MPFQFKAMGRNPGATRPIEAPIPTIVAARENHAIVQPFLLPRQGYYDCRRDKPTRSIDEPVPTVTASHSPAHIAMPFLLACNHGGDDDRSHSPTEPMATITTKTGHSLVVPFLTKYYGQGTAVDVADPLDTVTCNDRFGLATIHLAAGELGNYLAARAAELGDDSPEMRSLIKTMVEFGIYDIGFRMLTNQELLLAQGFPAGYRLDGAKTLAEQTKLIGNAVPPPFSKAICTAIAEAA